MNLRNPLLAIGAVLLLIGAVVLPASAAGQYLGNSTDCPNVDCDGNMFQHQNGALTKASAATEDSVAANITDNPAGDTERKMFQHQYRIASGAAEDSTSSSPQGSQVDGDHHRYLGSAVNQGNGDGNRTRTQSQLHDGSCDNCQKS
ncbi:MAG: hypothetical protein LUO93_10625 [Methanomicrobiales archaeon]|nr:hypothetical protein [Methanomicrobiales archaeon]